MKIWVLVILIIYAFFALNTVQEDILNAKKKAYEENAIQAFQVLLDSQDHQAIKHCIINEHDVSVRVQYKAMALTYIEKRTKEIVSLVQIKEMDADSARRVLDELHNILFEVDRLYQSFDTVETFRRSDIHYNLGLFNFKNLNYTKAKADLEQVNEKDINYPNARRMLSTINASDAFWNERTSNNRYGCNPNSLTYQNGTIVFPHIENDVAMIVRHHVEVAKTEVIPIVRSKGNYRIKGINVVGDDIYFAMGEEVGCGYGLDHPYNIYRMKEDGSELTCLAKGHYFDLICYRDTFYALSYDEGLVEFDRHMMNKKVIAEGDIVSMYPCERGVYYTLRDNKSYSSQDSLFLYNGEKHIRQLSGRNLRCYLYDDQIIYQRYAYSDVEHLYLVDQEMEGQRRLLNVNISNFICRIDDTILMSTEGQCDQNQYLSYAIDTREIKRYSQTYEIIDYQIVGACVENKTLLIKKQDGIYTSDLSLHEVKKIEIPDVDTAVLRDNQKKIITNNYYTNEEEVLMHDDYWQYSSHDTYVSIDRQYVSPLDATIYIAHVRTKNTNEVSIGYFDKSPGRKRARADHIAQVNDAAFAVNGDFWAEGNNPWTGIIIRDGKVYKKQFAQDMIAFHPDDGMECYSTQQDNITPEELLAQGVEDTLSFGPVLLDDFEYGTQIDDNFLWHKNPRTAIGMIDPNHYVFICCDGRSKKSRGLTLRRLAELFKELGCSEAYNLDGGQSMSIVFMGEMLNTHEDETRPCKHRIMSEIVYVARTNEVSDHYLKLPSK